MRRRLTSFSLVTLMVLGMALSGCGDTDGTQEETSPGLNDTNETSPGL